MKLALIPTNKLILEGCQGLLGELEFDMSVRETKSSNVLFFRSFFFFLFVQVHSRTHVNTSICVEFYFFKKRKKIKIANGSLNNQNTKTKLNTDNLYLHMMTAAISYSNFSRIYYLLPLLKVCFTSRNGVRSNSTI